MFFILIKLKYIIFFLEERFKHSKLFITFLVICIINVKIIYLRRLYICIINIKTHNLNLSESTFMPNNNNAF